VFLGFSIVVVAENPYTQQQPVGLALVSVLVWAGFSGCRLIVDSGTIRLGLCLKQACCQFGHNLKSMRPHSNAGITLKNWKTIGKIATFFAIATFVFTAFQAATTYLLLALYSTGAPAEYIALYILNTITPYLVIAVLSLIVAVMAKGEVEEQQQEEALPQEKEEQTPEVNA